MERHKKKRAQLHNDDKVTSNNKRTKNTSSYVQILATGMDTQDTSPSILLFFDSHRYIFNAGEGLLRFCTEHNIKPSKIGDMFLTRVCSETASGLAGLLLTLKGIKENRQHPKDYHLTGSDAVSPRESSHLDGLRSDHGIDIWGPPDVEHFLNALKSFVPYDMMRRTHIIGETKNTKSCDEAIIDVERTKDPCILVDNELVRISATLLKPAHTTGETVVIYICELSDIPGKFDPIKAASYGVDRKFYGTLQKGEPVYVSNMKILPEYVLDPSIPGPVVLIVDCPTEEHMKELVSAQFFQCYFEDTACRTEDLKTVTCVIHMSPASVTEITEYQDWMKKFGSAQHIMAGHQKKNLNIPVLRASARITSRLNYLCPQLFPARVLSSVKNMDVSPNLNGSCEDLSTACFNSISSENLLKFHLRPYKRQGLDYSEVPSLLYYEKIVDDLLAEKPLIANDAKLVSKIWEKNDCMHNNERCSFVNSNANFVSSDNAKETINDHLDIPPCLENITREDMEIVFLGTGSSQPSNYRNVSSIFVNLFSNGCLLLDCGEGTFAQMIRRFGIRGAEDAVKDLRLIWISHMHADHHAGLVRILAARAKLMKKDLVSREEPLLVIGPKQLQRYLKLYSKIEDLNMSFLDSEGTTAISNPDLIDDILKEKLHAAGLESLYSVHVEHSINDAFGVVIKAAERFNSAGKTIPGWKLVYSGDTKPCDSLKEAAFGATLLIHEATFEDMMEKDAKHKGHSTTTQAIETGAGAYRIILTHFSQRYPKVPVINDCYMDKTCIAFDMMTINAADLPAMPKVLPYIQNLFADDQNADEAIEMSTGTVLR